MKALIALLRFTLVTATVCCNAASTNTNKNAIIAPERINVPGKHVQLPQGTLYIPDFFQLPSNKKADVVLFFHGASWCSEQNFYAARKNAVLLSVNAKSMPTFGREETNIIAVLDMIAGALRKEDIPVFHLDKICLSSFSGGYVAVRDILRHKNLVKQISDVVLADSLYAARVPGKTNELDPSQMQPFLDYSRRAAAGKCRFIFSQLYPPEEQYRGNTTTLAASYLIDQLKVERKPGGSRNSRGALLLYRADKNGFHILGYAGMTNQDHFDHFYALSDLLKETSFSSAPN